MNIIFYPDKNSSTNSRLPEASHNNGYWAKMGNSGLEVFDVSSETHIKFIIENPELFNLTSEKIENTYKEFNEPLNLEGKAREALIVYSLQVGWVRVRHYVGKNDYWSLQCDDTKTRKKELKAFVYWAIEQKVMTYRDDLVVMGYNDNDDYKKYGFQNGGAGQFLREKKKK